MKSVDFSKEKTGNLKNVKNFDCVSYLNILFTIPTMKKNEATQFKTE